MHRTADVSVVRQRTVRLQRPWVRVGAVFVDSLVPMVNYTETTCCLCDHPAKTANTRTKFAKEVVCESCGTYEVADELGTIQGDWSEHFRDLRPYLICHTVQTTEKGVCERFTADNWQQIAEQHKRSSPATKAQLLFDLIARRSEGKIGAMVTIQPSESDLFDCLSHEEARLLFGYLMDQGLIREEQMMNVYMGALTFAGWEEIETRRRAAEQGATCFVAMSFNKKLDPAYSKGVVPAVSECGYEPHRVDQGEDYNHRIADEIIAGIRGAKFVIADFTDQRPGVYYEAGFAGALDREVIFCCREDDLKKCHFDTRDFNHIVWTDPEDLRKKLVNRIIRTVGKAGNR